MVEQDYIKQEIAKAVLKNKQLKSQGVLEEVIPLREKSNFVTTFLYSCIVLVILATVTGAIIKFNAIEANQKNYVTKNDTKAYVNRSEVGGYMTRSESKEAMDVIENKIANVEKEVDGMGDKIWLLGIANNENAMIAKDTIKKYHPKENTDFIVFERDWKINRSPKSINMNEEFKKKIEEHIVK